MAPRSFLSYAICSADAVGGRDRLREALHRPDLPHLLALQVPPNPWNAATFHLQGAGGCTGYHLSPKQPNSRRSDRDIPFWAFCRASATCPPFDVRRRRLMELAGMNSDASRLLAECRSNIKRSSTLRFPRSFCWPAGRQQRQVHSFTSFSPGRRRMLGDGGPIAGSTSGLRRSRRRRTS
jgi:hypothetical protein